MWRGVMMQEVALLTQQLLPLDDRMLPRAGAGLLRNRDLATIVVVHLACWSVNVCQLVCTGRDRLGAAWPLSMNL